MSIPGMRLGTAPAYRLYVSTTDTCDGDLDLIAIERAMNGDRVQLTIPEKIRAAQVLEGRGFDFTAIGRRIGSDRSTVAGWKANGWKPGASKPAPQPKRQPPKCGERRMYRQHIRLGETPCDDCRAANSASDRRYRLTGSTAAAA